MYLYLHVCAILIQGGGAKVYLTPVENAGWGFSFRLPFLRWRVLFNTDQLKILWEIRAKPQIWSLCDGEVDER